MHETDDDHDHDDHEGGAGHAHAAYAETAPGGMAIRVLLTILGAGLMIVGAFLNWLGTAGTRGVDAEARVFWSTDVAGQANFITSAGVVVIVIALLALLGLTFASGWLTRLAGALGVIAFILFVITLYRADLGFDAIGMGMWAILAGAVLVLIGGFLGTRRVMA